MRKIKLRLAGLSIGLVKVGVERILMYVIVVVMGVWGDEIRKGVLVVGLGG
ncbi:hypothetical protein [Bacillus sp. WP8]|uniref:hypothetical protein n=1 Tax=Bacillus sp. WP8 TaxID=756828 RepID=UPI00164292C8|nr:hypothetical protein [Bacillus sp. WP8]